MVALPKPRRPRAIDTSNTKPTPSKVAGTGIRRPPGRHSGKVTMRTATARQVRIAPMTSDVKVDRPPKVRKLKPRSEKVKFATLSGCSNEWPSVQLREGGQRAMAPLELYPCRKAIAVSAHDRSQQATSPSVRRPHGVAQTTRKRPSGHAITPWAAEKVATAAAAIASKRLTFRGQRETKSR